VVDQNRHLVTEDVLHRRAFGAGDAAEPVLVAVLHSSADPLVVVDQRSCLGAFVGRPPGDAGADAEDAVHVPTRPA
jgi:hypothetical protein